MNKGYLSNLLRNLGLIFFTDHLRYLYQKVKNHKINRRFKTTYPEVEIPPDYLIYESFQLNYHKYFTESRSTAASLLEMLQVHTELKNLKILDWGCGPGRIIRHLPSLLPKGCSFYGSDYNANSIAWCKRHLPGIEFNHNSLEARLPYPDNTFHLIYGISILTHLSEEMHFAWIGELHRVLKTGGIMLQSTQGEHFKVKLTLAEQEQFNMGNLVVRGKVKEGHRTYSAFHPPGFLKLLFKDFDILEHKILPVQSEKWLPQDIWILKKIS
jgi:ubiquinone/menaquinone biosynthesis C-methylase UbiE